MSAAQYGDYATGGDVETVHAICARNRRRSSGTGSRKWLSYRDTHWRAAQVVTAVCPHLGCIVRLESLSKKPGTAPVTARVSTGTEEFSMVRQILASDRLTSRSVFAGGTVPSTIQCIRLQRASFTVASGILGLQGEMKRMPDPRRPVIRLILFVGSLVWACGASAQTPRIELGLQLSGIRNGVLREYPLAAAAESPSMCSVFSMRKPR